MVASSRTRFLSRMKPAPEEDPMDSSKGMRTSVKSAGLAVSRDSTTDVCAFVVCAWKHLRGSMLLFSRKSANASCKDGFWNSVNGIWATRSGKSQTKAPLLASPSAEGGDVSNASNVTTSTLALLFFCQWVRATTSVSRRKAYLMLRRKIRAAFCSRT